MSLDRQQLLICQISTTRFLLQENPSKPSPSSHNATSKQASHTDNQQVHNQVDPLEIVLPINGH
jgi:hypothetical protein